MTALEIDRSGSVQAADKVFELRGVNLAGESVASLRLRVGTVVDIPQLLAGTDDFGSEIVVTVGSSTTRSVTRETQLYHIRAGAPEEEQFLELPEVSATLRQAAIVVDAIANPAGESVFSVANCAASILNTSPVAQQCCFEKDFVNGTDWVAGNTTFVRSNDGAEVVRQDGRMLYSNCSAVDGSACSGAACYWGPNGFARPTATAHSGGLVWQITSVGSGGAGRCKATQVTPPITVFWFTNVTGTFPTGAGCPGGNGGGGNGAWDY